MVQWALPGTEAAAEDAAKPAATLVRVSASSIEAGRGPELALDGKLDTRWCASSGNPNQWFQVEFIAACTLTGVRMTWEFPQSAYQYRLEGSMDGSSWFPLHDASQNTVQGPTSATFPASPLRFLRITTVGTSLGWISIREIKLEGPDIGIPRVETKTAPGASAAADDYSKGGNIPPRIVKLSPQEEAEILKDVSVPDGFDVTLFAPWQSANYPVFVAASPAGDLYVSSDGNGSLGRDPDRGRILRLRDTDGDGRADAASLFVPSIDSPRGLVWDHDRLIVLHPPHITEFIDRDHDGVAEESRRLVSNIAFGFKDRPADHTTNGLQLGADGWIYVAGGDFGFMQATGTDGRRLQHRGGGVIRFRPDGSGLELFSTGTRNIFDLAVSPLLDLFARDNTNDGGGWDIRFHHFSGMEDHGYPRLFINFTDEQVAPLGDYGGGSGCGAVYIHEPGFPKPWAASPFTCDWGRAGLFHHAVRRAGGTFLETLAPRKFISISRPTDADIDGMSRVYVSSWKGPATFNWKGPEHGYIVRVTPGGYTPEPLPDFDALSAEALIGLLESPSQVRALAAQRTLLRRPREATTDKRLLALAADTTRELRTRVLALYAISQRGLDSTASAAVIEQLSSLVENADDYPDTDLTPFVMRALGDMGLDLRTRGEAGPAPVDLLIRGARATNIRTRLEAVIAAARQQAAGAAGAVAESLGHTDPVLSHTAVRAYAGLAVAKPALDILDNPQSSDRRLRDAAWALMKMHSEPVVSALIERLATAPPRVRPYIITALCRLYHREADWKGDHWGGRPDSRGPYFDPVTWEVSPRILAALSSRLDSTDTHELGILVRELRRNRVPLDTAFTRLMETAAARNVVTPILIEELQAAPQIPANALPMLMHAARQHDTPPALRVALVDCLLKSGQEETLGSVLASLTILARDRTLSSEYAAALQTFLAHLNLPAFHGAVATYADRSAELPFTRHALNGLLQLAGRPRINDQVRTSAQQALDRAWQDPVRRSMLIQLAATHNHRYLDSRIAIALDDTHPHVAATAAAAARHMNIKPPEPDTTPRIGTLDTDAAVKAVTTGSGDPVLGASVFDRASCTTCHVVDRDRYREGIFLGDIADIYRRNELAEAILMPGKTIAQGFATVRITLQDGRILTGFVTDESAQELVIRDAAGRAETVHKHDIVERTRLPESMMPAGLMNKFSVREFSSLLDYLENLAAD